MHPNSSKVVKYSVFKINNQCSILLNEIHSGQKQKNMNILAISCPDF